MVDIVSLNGSRERLRDAAMMDQAVERYAWLEALTDEAMDVCEGMQAADALHLIDDSITALIGLRLGLYSMMEETGLEFCYGVKKPGSEPG